MADKDPVGLADNENDAFKQRDFVTYYSGGGSRAFSPPGEAPLIHAKIGALRDFIGGIKARPSKEEYGPKFPVKSAKELFQKLAQGLKDLNLVCFVVEQRVNHHEYKWTKERQGKQVNGTGTLVHVTSIVRLAAEDGSFVDFIGSGHGKDDDDKGGGKASTYAWKDAILKGLTLPEEDLLDTDNDDGKQDPEVPAGLPAPVAEGNGAEPVAAPKRRGRPPGSTNAAKQAAAQPATQSATPAASKPAGTPDYVTQVKNMLTTCKKMADNDATAALVEIYKIRDEYIRPKTPEIHKALTPSYAEARDYAKSKGGVA